MHFPCTLHARSKHATFAIQSTPHSVHYTVHNPYMLHARSMHATSTQLVWSLLISDTIYATFLESGIKSVYPFFISIIQYITIPCTFHARNLYILLLYCRPMYDTFLIFFEDIHSIIPNLCKIQAPRMAMHALSMQHVPSVLLSEFIQIFFCSFCVCAKSIYTK